MSIRLVIPALICKEPQREIVEVTIRKRLMRAVPALDDFEDLGVEDLGLGLVLKR